jgi:hypothetical protein
MVQWQDSLLLNLKRGSAPDPGSFSCAAKKTEPKEGRPGDCFRAGWFNSDR